MEESGVGSESPPIMDLDPSDFPEHPLLNHLILSKVFGNLDTLDLVRCSKVNKFWFQEARNLLKSKRCYARTSDVYPCLDLRKIDEYLETIVQPANILYNGLHLNFDQWHGKGSPNACLKDYNEELEQDVPDDIPYTNILNKLALKYLKINWLGRTPLDECPAALLIPEILLYHRETLEEIEIEEGPGFDWVFRYDNDVYDGSLCFPKLKMLKRKPLDADSFDREMVWRLVKAAVNLEDLLICVSSKDYRKGLIPPNRCSVIKALCYQCNCYQDLRAYKKFASTEPKLRSFKLKCGNHRDESEVHDEDYDGFWETFHSILESSRETLEMLRLPACVLPIQLNDEHVFPRVELLSLGLPFKFFYQSHHPPLRSHKMLQHYDFAKVFPKLTSVILTDHDPVEEDLVNSDEVEDDLRSPTLCATSVRILTLNDFVKDFCLTYAAGLFPHVTKLELNPEGTNEVIPYGTIWAQFPHLETLLVRETSWSSYEKPRTINYDADFLGIFEDEAEELRKEEVENLKNLHIVPIKPAITTLLNLREVTVTWMENRTYVPVEGKHFFLSPAACFLPIQRMQSRLKFKLVCSSGHLGVTALEDYVKVKIW